MWGVETNMSSVRRENVLAMGCYASLNSKTQMRVIKLPTGEWSHVSLRRTIKTIWLPSGGELLCLSSFIVTIRYRGKDYPFKVFVVHEHKVNNLFSHFLSVKMNLMRHVRCISRKVYISSLTGSTALPTWCLIPCCWKQKRNYKGWRSIMSLRWWYNLLNG